MKETLLKGLWLGITLAALVANSGCGSTPADSTPKSTTSQSGGQVVVNIYNSGTQDMAFGTQYTIQIAMTSSVPSVVLRTQGVTQQNGTGVGVDFGNGLGQCFYSGNTASQTVFTLTSCNNGLVEGQSLPINQGQVITVWSYDHVNSSDSIVELVLQGNTL